MASVSRDNADIMLCEGDQGNPATWVWIGVDGCAPLFEEYAAKSATIRQAPTNYPWAYEMHVEDSNGHVPRFGSESQANRSFSAWVFWYRGSSLGGPAAIGVRQDA